MSDTDASGVFLKCDAPGCTHRERVEQVSAEHVGKPCPVCGASLLTAEDWAQWEPMALMMRLLKEISPPVPPKDAAALVKVTANVHGAKFNLTIEKLDKDGSK